MKEVRETRFERLLSAFSRIGAEDVLVLAGLSTGSAGVYLEYGLGVALMVFGALNFGLGCAVTFSGLANQGGKSDGNPSQHGQ